MKLIANWGDRGRLRRLIWAAGGVLIWGALLHASHPSAPAPARAVWPLAQPTAPGAGATPGLSPSANASAVASAVASANAAASAAASAAANAGSAGHWQRQAQGLIPMPAHTPAAHASSLVAQPAGHAQALWAFWFAGTRESAADVGIAAAAWSRSQQRWGAARWVLERAQAGAALGWGVRRLGNPVGWRDASGRVHLFVVGTGLGGWAASRIIHLRQQQPSGTPLEQVTFVVQRALPLGWLWNTSHLVRTAPLALADGGMALPVYAELGHKFALLLRFDAQGRWLGQTPIGRNPDRLQPTLLATGPAQWQALMRTQGPAHRIARADSADAGAHWRDAGDLPLANPDASVAALSLRPDWHVLAANLITQGRHRLDLAQGLGPADAPWQTLDVLAQGAPGTEFSYPALAWVDGALWVSYTEQRTRIAWSRWVWASAGGGAADGPGPTALAAAALGGGRP